MNTNQLQIALSRDCDIIWLNQNQIAGLYQVSLPKISMNMRKILSEGELDHVSSVKQYLIVQAENKRQVLSKISLYSRDMILAITYRVRSKKPSRVSCGICVLFIRFGTGSSIHSNGGIRMRQ